MRVYHGSCVEVAQPDIVHSRKKLDFGVGFYITPISEEWLDFVFECRRGQDESNYEIVAGGIANDKVFDTVELYFDGIISKKDAIGRLTYEKPNFQICLRTQNVIDDYLLFERSSSV